MNKIHDWRQGFTEEEILNKRRHLARLWRQKLDMVMDIEAVHFLKLEQEQKAKMPQGSD